MSRPWEQQPWAAPYHAAMFEREEDRLPVRIKAARKAIDLRVAEMWCKQQSDTGEMGALQDALNFLTLLEKHEALRKRVA